MRAGRNLFLHEQLLKTGSKESGPGAPTDGRIVEAKTAGDRLQCKPEEDPIARTNVFTPTLLSIRLGIEDPDLFDESETMHASKLHWPSMLTMTILFRIELRAHASEFAFDIIDDANNVPAVPAVNFRVHVSLLANVSENCSV